MAVAVDAQVNGRGYMKGSSFRAGCRDNSTLPVERLYCYAVATRLGGHMRG